MNPSANPPPPPASAPVSPAAVARLRRTVIWVVVIVIIGVVAGLVPRWRQRAALAAETRELVAQTVAVTVPTPGTNSAGASLPAELKPLVEAPIYARASGYLKRWFVDIGAKVEAGQLLAEIETPELDQELARARAQLAQADAALALAKITADRWADLLKTASVSEQEAAEKKSDLALKAATVDAARAEVQRLAELQSFARVTAPFAGTITARLTDVGQLITAGSGKELFRLAQIERLRAYVRVPQTLSRGVAAGQMAELTVPEIPGRAFPAKIVRTAGAMDAQSRTLLTELEVDNARGEILSGSYAQVRLAETKVEAVLTLPANTLLFRAEGPQVGVVTGEGDMHQVELHNVTIGRDFGPTVEVLSGVQATDRVVLNPADSLVSGMTVRIVAPAKPAAGK
ncbi:MAG: efflux RND transporter periplasmic adaptor subunit [Verrucomicrobiota bacterium]|jgi:RND family efflux transporter MFP subunit